MSRTDQNISLSRRLYLNRTKLKLELINRTSGLLAGFAMVALVAISTDSGPAAGSATQAGVSELLLIVFVMCTTLLVAVHLMTLMISTWILPHVEDNMVLHNDMRVCVNVTWVFSTGLGIFLFLAEIVLISWIKFYRFSHKAAAAATFIVIPTGILCIIYSFMFYKSLRAHKYQSHSDLHSTDEDIYIV